MLRHLPKRTNEDAKKDRLDEITRKQVSNICVTNKKAKILQARRKLAIAEIYVK
jgi:hypothetical protein